MNFKYILFDLDGTLTDPVVGITNSVMYALEKFGIKVADRRELYRFIGPPLWESFQVYYGFSRKKAERAVEYYREYFADTGIFENSVYDGISELLGELKDSGKTLLVASSKPKVFVDRVLEHFGLFHYFDYIAGSELDGTRVNKDEVIAHALKECGIYELDQCIMIGDREHDIFGAKKVGIASVGVLYGYGNREEHGKAGADYIVETVEELKILFASKEALVNSI